MIYAAEKKKSPVSAEIILNAIDSFCYSRHWMMHIGDVKAKILEVGVERTARKSNFVEIGSYCGYSAISLASKLSKGKLYCIEISPACVKWTQRMVDLANLTDKVEVLLGSSIEVLPYLKEKVESIDLLFLDHDKSKYLQDLLVFESSGLLKSGTVVIADNILSFGCPMVDYMSHVRAEGGYYSSSVLHHCSIEYSAGELSLSTIDLEDGIEISIFR